MLKSKNHLMNLNDGVVGIYRERERRTDFKARSNPRTLADLDLVDRLCYEEKSCRMQDFDFASQSGFTLSRKVRTHARPDVDSECRAVIGDDLYSISYIDRSARDMHLYMTSVGKLEANDG